jgi:HEAT repeat protein/cyclophilin family peptidyl-prolyl cis-trans isomerase
VVRLCVALTVLVGASACASAPPPAVAPASRPEPPLPTPTFEEKQAWIPRLEDRRLLREADLPSLPSPAFEPNLLALLTDADARLRRRAALAVGRVGLRDGVPPLIRLLDDTEPDVRQTAAFALGLIGDRQACDALTAALGDPAPAVQASAAQALGLIGEPATAKALGDLAARLAPTAALTDEAIGQRDTPAAALAQAVFALARLKAYEPLLAAVLDESGQPRRSWPIAFALQRIADPRSLPTLLRLARDAHPDTRAFAIAGLGALKDRSATPVLMPLVRHAEPATAVEAVRALGRIGDPAVAGTLIDLILDPAARLLLRVEAVAALGSVGGDGAADLLIDLVAHRSAPVRAAAMRSLARLDPGTFVAVLSGFDPDRDWTVRAALATALGEVNPEAGLPRLRQMLTDQDQRVIPAVLDSLAKLGAPETAGVALDKLKADDPAVRAAAARMVGALKPPDAAAALAAAYEHGDRDVTYIARAAALTALAGYGRDAAAPVLTKALQDKDWAVRVRAAALVREIDPTANADLSIRPAPTHLDAAIYEAPRILAPSVSPQAFVETDRGTIQIELAVIDAPLTVENFVGLARRGFFDGLAVHRVVPNYVMQTGDPRGDSEGGPGYTIRDELNELPYARGTVGMALDWEDTGGSQFFITHAPQPQLEARYTVFGRVTGGMDVVAQIEPGDIVRRVRIWDGKTE